MQSKPNTVTAESLVQAARNLVPKLKERAAQTERDRKVPDETVAEMQAAGLFDILKPKMYGGFEMDPQVFYDVQM
ncbi:MAG: flavin-dependent monooxygenase, partial [Rhizobium sp.]